MTNDKIKKGALSKVLLWTILLISIIQAGLVLSQRGITEQTCKAVPSSFIRNFSSPENGSLTLKITFEILKGMPNDYEVTYGGGFERGFWYWDSEGRWNQEDSQKGRPSSYTIILHVTAVKLEHIMKQY